MTDDLPTAARAEAREYARTPRMNVGTVRDRIAEAHFAGWEAARAHLAAQEPSDAELDYVAAAISECDGIYFQDCIRRNPGIAQMYRRQARAALTAARRYEEQS